MTEAFNLDFRRVALILVLFFPFICCLKTGANLANIRYFHDDKYYKLINKQDLDFIKTTALSLDKSSAPYKEDHRINVLNNNTSNNNNVDTNTVVNGFLLLNAVAVLWGSQHVVIKSALSDYPSTSLLNLWRFAISSLLFIQPISRILTVRIVVLIRYAIHDCI